MGVAGLVKNGHPGIISLGRGWEKAKGKLLRKGENRPPVCRTRRRQRQRGTENGGREDGGGGDVGPQKTGGTYFNRFIPHHRRGPLGQVKVREPLPLRE